MIIQISADKFIKSDPNPGPIPSKTSDHILKKIERTRAAPTTKTQILQMATEVEYDDSFMENIVSYATQEPLVKLTKIDKEKRVVEIKTTLDDIRIAQNNNNIKARSVWKEGDVYYLITQ